MAYSPSPIQTQPSRLPSGIVGPPVQSGARWWEVYGELEEPLQAPLVQQPQQFPAPQATTDFRVQPQPQPFPAPPGTTDFRVQPQPLPVVVPPAAQTPIFSVPAPAEAATIPIDWAATPPAAEDIVERRSREAYQAALLALPVPGAPLAQVIQQPQAAAVVVIAPAQVAAPVLPPPPPPSAPEEPSPQEVSALFVSPSWSVPSWLGGKGSTPELPWTSFQPAPQPPEGGPGEGPYITQPLPSTSVQPSPPGPAIGLPVPVPVPLPLATPSAPPLPKLSLPWWLLALLALLALAYASRGRERE